VHSGNGVTVSSAERTHAKTQPHDSHLDDNRRLQARTHRTRGSRPLHQSATLERDASQRYTFTARCSRCVVPIRSRGRRLYWAGAESKIYAEPKRLERLGYLDSEKMPGKTRERTHYRLTDKGVRALQEWLTLPSHFPRIQSEAAIRVQASDLADDPAVVLKSLKPLSEEIDELSALLDESERREPQFPHRQRQLRLLRSLGRRVLRAQLEWLDEVEQEPRTTRHSSRLKPG
jgi:DNA-binding PadR family transcriptional regulator